MPIRTFNFPAARLWREHHLQPSGQNEADHAPPLKKNIAGMLAACHPECKYVATSICPTVCSHELRAQGALDRRPTFIHSLDPCPRAGTTTDQSHELGELAVTTGSAAVRVQEGVLKLYGKTREIAEGRYKRARARLSD